MGGIIGSVLFVVAVVVLAIVASRRKHRQHAIDIQQLIELRGRVDQHPSTEDTPGSPEQNQVLGGNAEPDASTK